MNILKTILFTFFIYHFVHSGFAQETFEMDKIEQREKLAKESGVSVFLLGGELTEINGEKKYVLFRVEGFKGKKK